MSVLGNIIGMGSFGSDIKGVGSFGSDRTEVSSREKCYERLDIRFTCTSKQRSDFPNGLNSTPIPGGGFDPPTGTVTTILEYKGKVTNKERYCESPGLRPQKRGSAKLLENKLKMARNPSNPNHIRLEAAMKHEIVLSFWDCNCHTQCTPTEYNEDIVYWDGCSKKYPDEEFAVRVTKRNKEKITGAMGDAIWNAHVNSADNSFCFAPGQNTFQMSKLLEALGLLCNNVITDTCCDLCFADDSAVLEPENADFTDGLLDQLEAVYNSTHNQSDCNSIMS